MSDPSIRHSNVPSLTVRPIARGDAGAVAELSEQLGYEASVEAIDKHIAELSCCPERQIAFVACLEMNGEIVGWIEPVILRELQSPPYCFISGLIVREERRGLGIAAGEPLFVIRLEPDHFDAHLDLGICFAQKGFYAEAEKAVRLLHREFFEAA